MKAESSYCTYIPPKPLSEAFPDDKIPILQMAHLRELDFPITRRISYERTVDEFLLQLATNDALRALRNRKDMVICLNEEGALIRENEKWTLLFTPAHGERLTLAEDAPLYPVLKQLMKNLKTGLVCSLPVPERSLKTLVSGNAPFSILDDRPGRNGRPFQERTGVPLQQNVDGGQGRGGELSHHQGSAGGLHLPL